MNFLRVMSVGAVSAALLGATMVAPASAQSQGNQGNNQANNSCTVGGQGGTSRSQLRQDQQGGPQAVIANVLGLALQNLAVGAPISLATGNFQVVCLNDVLNQNQLQVLQNFLNSNVITALNNIFVNVQALNILSNAHVVAVDPQNNNVYVLR